MVSGLAFTLDVVLVRLSGLNATVSAQATGGQHGEAYLKGSGTSDQLVRERGLVLLLNTDVL